MAYREQKKLYSSHAGHAVYSTTNRLWLNYARPMHALSTSPLNGGIRVIEGALNQRLDCWVDKTSKFPGGSITAYLKKQVEELGMSTKTATALMTTAAMENYALVHEGYQELSLFALVTGGTSVNALRTGDPASYVEEASGEFQSLGGTINIFLTMEFSLPVEALARTVILITEAKTAALQDLGVMSCYSKTLATGTGTDGVVTACHLEDDRCYHDVGGHSKIGELIGRAVKKAVKESVIKDYLGGKE